MPGHPAMFHVEHAHLSPLALAERVPRETLGAQSIHKLATKEVPMPSPERLVILDRDGVINRDSDDYVKSLAEWIPYPAAIDAIARLSRAGWTVAVATNQSGIAVATMTRRPWPRCMPS